MNLFFICGSFELGKDGVGDYTRKLSIEFAKRGYLITIIALNDKYINERNEMVISNFERELTIIRIPAQWNIKERFRVAKQAIEQNIPSWILLQYVPFSYDSAGMPFSLLNFLQDIKKTISTRVFTFFHEVSIELSFQKFKHFPLAITQTLIARRLLKLSDQSATSIDLYAKRLSFTKRNIPLIPIGSNIAATEEDGKAINDLKVKLQIAEKKVVVTFGVRDHASLIDAFQKVYTKYSNIHLLILGKFKEAAAIPKEIAGNVTVTGFLPEKEIMKYLQASDLFIQLNNNSTGGINNKSGSLAAAFAAGLPIIGKRGKITNELLLQHQPCIFINSMDDLPSSITEFMNLANAKATDYRTKSRRFYDQFLSWERIAEQYSNILKHS